MPFSASLKWLTYIERVDNGMNVGHEMEPIYRLHRNIKSCEKSDCGCDNSNATHYKTVLVEDCSALIS